MTRDQLVGYALAAMHSFVPPSDHAFVEPAATTEARYEAFASVVADEAIANPAVAASPERTAIVLVSIASFESAFAARVFDCKVAGGSKATPAWGPFQDQGNKAEACGSLTTSVRLALRRVRESVEACPRWPLSVYAVGACRQDDKAKWRWLRATRWMKVHPYEEEDDG